MKKICAAYLRVSTHDQEEYSPDSQLKLIREYAEKHEMILPENYVYRDDGVSGRSAEKRPGFQRMIAEARQKPSPFACILVWKFSRFARNQEESVVYKSLLKKENGVEVVSISEPLLDGPYGGLIERVIEWFDAFYSANLAVEVRRGMEERVSRGLAVSGAPLGYVYQKGELVLAPEEADTVRFLFRQFLEGVPLTALARRLNALGVRTKRGGAWETRTVRYVLENPVYLGKLRLRGKLIEGKHPALVSEREFAAVGARLQTLRKEGTAGGYAEKNPSFLNGRIKCGACGGTLARTGSGWNCSRYSHGKCKISHYIGSEKLENLVKAALSAHWGALEYVPACLQQERDDSQKRLLQRRLRKEQESLLRCREAYTAGVDTLEEYRANKAEIAARIGIFEDGLKRIAFEKTKLVSKPAPVDALEQLLDENLSAEEKRRLFRALADRIVFHKESKTLELVYALPGEARDSHSAQ